MSDVHSVCLSDVWDGETGAADERLKVETLSKPEDPGTENLLLLLPSLPNTSAQPHKGLKVPKHSLVQIE